ncbi:serine hydrolase domain-containing protein [Paenibacillus sp. NPDC057967]|uniref:serine hydrolase domain-containing protein n=1 Tax=Paenibacillus sp. NPDC057967 TaxID=3346293 RepID=UPI0036DAF9B4
MNVRKNIAWASWLIMLSALLILSGCTRTAGEVKQTEQSAYDQQWQTALPQDHGFDSAKLDEIFEDIKNRPIYSAVVVKDGYIVGEYYKENNPGKVYPVNSVTKSITSILIGIAIDQGKIESIDKPIFDYYPELAAQETDPLKKSITIAHLLSMTSGFDWPEWTPEWNYFVYPMFNAPDWSTFVLQREMASAPGERFNYNTGGSQILASILKMATGKSEADFGKEVLFEPLGITRELDWPSSPDGSNSGGFGLQMTAREQAKLGYLYLQGGKWENKQIVPEQWVEKSTSIHSDGSPPFGTYGYHWWVGSHEGESYFHAMGYAGQYIFVAPESNLVVVFSSQSPNNSAMPIPIFTKMLDAIERSA